MMLDEKLDFKKIENKIKEHLTNFDLKNINNGDNNKIRYIEGPPTMNGAPHIGHVRGRIIKDLWYRYKTLQGFKIFFVAGWDTQGLPIELQAEKELGMSGNKSEILAKIGIEKLVLECRRIINKYHNMWKNMDYLLGMSFNQELAYFTDDNKYIEREWAILKKAHTDNILTEGYMVVAYCPNCQTSLSHAEINQAYKIVPDPSLYYKVKLKNEESFLIVWTTMPFTLITDALIGVNPNEMYVHVKVNNEIWVIGEKRLIEFMKEINITNYSILKRTLGINMQGKKYIHPLLNKIPELKKYAHNNNFHITVAEEFVDINTGSGLVHIAPANGEEDYKIAIKRKISIFNPINDEAKLTYDAGSYAGLFVRDADEIIINDIKKCNALVKISKINHKYPLCWRSHHRIVWLARREFFYMINKLDNKVIDAAHNVNYYFDQAKNRFEKIIKEKQPWCISRERFWGCPIPIWKCSKCNNVKRLFSRNEIIKAAYKLPDGNNFELHRPWIDKIIIKCEVCDEIMQRVPFVLDTWHNSGSAAYTSISEKQYYQNIPVPFLTEGIDQTRGWAYTLLIENIILTGKPISIYKSFLFQGHVLDKNGNKMSKSIGNVIDAIKILTEYPVDVIRFYFIWKSNPIEPISFNIDELMSRPYQILNTLYNIHLYFKQNSEYDKFNYNNNSQVILESPEKWLLSKLQNVINIINSNNNKCRFHETAKALEEFIINILSQYYIPIIRKELWEDDSSKIPRRTTIYNTLSYVLKTIYVLIHPICPFISEYLYLNLNNKKKTILLESWPIFNKSQINLKLEKAFEIMQNVISIAAAARMKKKLKRRWPLNEAIICTTKEQKVYLEYVYDLLISQLNVKHCKIIEIDENNIIKQILKINSIIPINPSVKLVMKKLAPKIKNNINMLQNKINNIDPYKIIYELESNKIFTCIINNKKLSIQPDEFILDFEPTIKFIKNSKNNIIVFIPATRDKKIQSEGIIKDLARRLQALRKENGYKPTIILNTASILDTDKEMHDIINNNNKELAFLVRVNNINFSSTCKKYKNEEIDGKKIRIGIE